MVQKTVSGGLKLWSVIWGGQLVSLVGSGLTSFALGVWAYQRSGSVTQFALIIFFAGLPGILLAPLAGTLVDKWDRKKVMLGSDTLTALTTLAIALLLWQDALQIWHIYIVVALNSVFRTFQWPAYIAATTLLVPKKHYARVGGMMQFGQAASEIVAPILAGLLMVAIDIEGILLADFVTYFVAMGALALVKIPKPEVSEEGAAAAALPFRKRLVFGFTYISARKGLLGLLLFFAMINFVVGISTVLLTPLILSFANEAVLGTVLSVSSVGMLVGSIIMMVTGGPKKRIYGVLVFGLILGVAVFVAGLRPYAPLVAAGIFLMMVGVPIINGSSQAIWQSKVAPDLQGRVFAVRRMVAQFTVPIADLAAGPLADFLFEPAMAQGGALAGLFGPLLGGVGEGRGIGLIYLTIAILPIAASILGWLYKPIRTVEEDLPDAVRDADEDEPAASRTADPAGPTDQASDEAAESSAASEAAANA
jgi:MFS family permease